MMDRHRVEGELFHAIHVAYLHLARRFRRLWDPARTDWADRCSPAGAHVAAIDGNLDRMPHVLRYHGDELSSGLHTGRCVCHDLSSGAGRMQ
jgi:hypothetical protein